MEVGVCKAIVSLLNRLWRSEEDARVIQTHFVFCFVIIIILYSASLNTWWKKFNEEEKTNAEKSEVDE